MKAVKLFTLLIFLSALIATSCKVQNLNTSSNSYTGTIEATGMTTYQYGTHTLNSPNSFYALRSSTVNLDLYMGKSVVISTSKIEGYPIEGGPDYLEVSSVKEIE